MIYPFPTRTRGCSRPSVLSALALMACAHRFASASALAGPPECKADGGGWGCYLPGIHQFLVVIAIILGLILLGVIVVAVRSYLKIKQDGKV